jgi:hypothetical protein
MKRYLINILSMALVLLATSFSEGHIRSNLTVVSPKNPAAFVDFESRGGTFIGAHELTAGETFSSILSDVGFHSREAHKIVLAITPFINLKKLKSSTKISFYSDGLLNCCRSIHIRKIVIEPPEGDAVQAVPANLESLDLVGGIPAVTWIAEKVPVKVETRLVSFAANILQGNLWRSAASAGIDPSAVSIFTDVLGWEVDFEQELQDSGSFSFIIEEVLSNGRHLRWSKIQAAEIFTGKRTVQAIYFSGNINTPPGYYRPDGQSLERMFLKNPIEGSRITSGFSFARLHPILKSSRPHLGIDYAAPMGTPIRSIGDGIVKEAEFHEGSGNFLKIRHNSVYETAYKHLSSFALQIKPGTRVERGEVIGFVGATGWATGPHLHFEVYRNGEYVDPVKEIFPSSNPIDLNSLSKFKKSSNFWLAQLPKKFGSDFLVRD